MEELSDVYGDHGLVDDDRELREGLRIVWLDVELVKPDCDKEGRLGVCLAVIYPSSSIFVELFHLGIVPL